jgi:hypothetical protein
VDILAHDRRTNATARAGVAATLGVWGQKWPASDAWCSFCHKVADLEGAFMVENRVRSVAPASRRSHAAAEARGSRPE